MNKSWGEWGVDREPISPPYSSCDVLIVDDESSHRAALAVMLEELGMRCMTAAGAEQG